MVNHQTRFKNTLLQKWRITDIKISFSQIMKVSSHVLTLKRVFEESKIMQGHVKTSVHDIVSKHSLNILMLRNDWPMSKLCLGLGVTTVGYKCSWWKFKKMCYKGKENFDSDLFTLDSRISWITWNASFTLLNMTASMNGYRINNYNMWVLKNYEESRGSKPWNPGCPQLKVIRNK